MTEQDRINFLICHLAHNNANVFAEKVGISKGNVSKMRSGKISVAKSVTKIIEAYPQVNRTWMETGEGYPGDISVELVKAHYQRKIERLEMIIDKLVATSENSGLQKD